MKCMIVDDEPLAIELLQQHVAKIPSLELVATAANALDALAILKKGEIELLFLDIQMPILTGIELMKTLSDPPAVIFTTAYREFAVESYELNAVDYLVKPITFIRFLKSVNKVLDMKKQAPIVQVAPTTSSSEAPESIYVNVNKKYVKVIYKEILYIESVKDYIHIHTGKETVVTREKISDFEGKLPEQFLRIHRSFIVNQKMITAFTSQDVEIGEKELPIGASYKTVVLSKLK